jgi:FkbM family methyltransferase
MVNKLFNIFCNRILIPQKGKLAAQAMFERLHELSLQGMNYGNGSDFENNGELQALNYIRTNLIARKKSLNVFDVGANSGGYVELVMKVFAKDAVKIFCFEPAKETFATLKKNYSKDKRVKVFNWGMGSKKETLKLYKSDKYSELSSVFQRRLDHFNIEMNIFEEIDIDTIDDFCNQEKISEIGFLKIDVEGNELQVLVGAQKMIAEDKISYIQFEFGGTGIDSRTFFQDFYYLLKDKYRVYRIVKDGLFLMENYKETNEVFSQVNFIAEHKYIK